MNKTELQKCKEDIVYFVETYIEPKQKLSDFQKKILRSFQNGEEIVIMSGRGGKRFLTTIAKEHLELKK